MNLPERQDHVSLEEKIHSSPRLSTVVYNLRSLKANKSQILYEPAYEMGTQWYLNNLVYITEIAAMLVYGKYIESSFPVVRFTKRS